MNFQKNANLKKAILNLKNEKKGNK